MNRKKTSKAALVAVAVALVALLAFCLVACDNEPAKPVLGVTVHSQQAPYSPDGAKPFTDGTQADVTGLPEGYTLPFSSATNMAPASVKKDKSSRFPNFWRQSRTKGLFFAGK